MLPSLASAGEKWGRFHALYFQSRSVLRILEVNLNRLLQSSRKAVI